MNLLIDWLNGGFQTCFQAFFLVSPLLSLVIVKILLCLIRSLSGRLRGKVTNVALYLIGYFNICRTKCSLKCHTVRLLFWIPQNKVLFPQISPLRSEIILYSFNQFVQMLISLLPFWSSLQLSGDVFVVIIIFTQIKKEALTDFPMALSKCIWEQMFFLVFFGHFYESAHHIICQGLGKPHSI